MDINNIKNPKVKQCEYCERNFGFKAYFLHTKNCIKKKIGETI